MGKNDCLFVRGREERRGQDEVPGLYVDRWVVLTSMELQNGREETGRVRQR